MKIEKLTKFIVKSEEENREMECVFKEDISNKSNEELEKLIKDKSFEYIKKEVIRI